MKRLLAGMLTLAVLLNAWMGGAWAEEGVATDGAASTAAWEGEGTPAPEDEGTPAPKDEGTPAPEDEGTPAPEDEGTPAPEGEEEFSAVLEAEYLEDDSVRLTVRALGTAGEALSYRWQRREPADEAEWQNLEATGGELCVSDLLDGQGEPFAAYRCVVWAGERSAASNEIDAHALLAGSGAALMSLNGASGACGSGLTWTLDGESGALVIRGAGKMTDYDEDDPPWGTGITSVVVEQGVTSVGNYAFLECDGLRSVSLPASLTRIGEGAFAYCGALRSIDLPSGEMQIGGFAFYRCFSLEDVVLPAGLKSIPDELFFGCGSMKSVVLPAGLTDIGADAFSFCSSLRTMELPAGLTSIGDGAFSVCESLESIWIPASVTHIGADAFVSNTGRVEVSPDNPAYASVDGALLTRDRSTLLFVPCGVTEYAVPSGVTRIEDGALYNCAKLETLTLPDSLTYIGESAFQHCALLRTIDIGAGVNYIAPGALSSMHSLQRITVSEGNTAYASADGALLDKACRTLIRVPENKEQFVIPSSVTRIENEALSSCKKLRTIEIPSGVTEIGDSAFYECEGLESLRLPAGLKSLGEGAICDCPALRSVVLPAGLTRIPSYNFTFCDSLEEVVVPSSVTSVGDYVFSYCANLKKLTLPASVRSIGTDVAVKNVDQGEVLILCEAGSVAERWARNNDLPYQIVGPAPRPSKVELDQTGTIQMNVGEERTLNAAVTPEGAEYTLSWKSSYARVATVENGVVRALSEGTARISVATNNGRTASVTVKVVDPYKPTGIKLNREGTVELDIDKALTLGYSLLPETAVSDVTWRSSSNSIATVENGVVTPHREGTVTITATTVKQGRRATVKVKVVDPYKPTGIVLSHTGTVEVNIDRTLTLGYSLLPETAVSDVTWRSSSNSIATVENGVVTPHREGTVTITATTVKQGRRATVKVKVVDPYKPTGIKLDREGTVEVDIDRTLTLGHSLLPETAVSDVTWRSSSNSIATVENGVVTPHREGTVTITATTVKQGRRATVKVKVVDPYKPTGIVLSHTGTVEMDIDRTLTLGYSLLPETAVSDVTWRSSSNSIATVENGVVTPHREGTVTITATTVKQGRYATVKVKVVDPYKATGISAAANRTVQVGDCFTLDYALTPSTATSAVTLTSGNKAVVQVNEDGTLTALREGTSTVVLRTSTGKTARTRVTVEKRTD